MNKFVIVILSGLVLCGSIEKHMGYCLLMPKHIEIPLYDSLGYMKIYDYIINDTLKDDYPLITIDSIIDSMAFVYVQYPMGSREDCKGWIRLDNLGIYVDAPGDTLRIYKTPDYNSEVSFEIRNAHWGVFYPIVDAHDEWLKIVIPNDSSKTGWLPPEHQSQNPYTPSC